MVKPQIISESPLSMADLKEKLKQIKKRDAELNFRATKTDEYLNQLGDLPDAEQAAKLVKKIEELQIPRIKQEHLVKIVDILPTTEDQLKMILQGYVLTLSPANSKKIVEIIKEFIPSKK